MYPQYNYNNFFKYQKKKKYKKEKKEKNQSLDISTVTEFLFWLQYHEDKWMTEAK
jgi:hypothetical protein